MKEDLLQYAWRMQQFDARNLQSTDGQTIQIQSFGQHNTDAGPDFTEARIRIGDTLWAGNVEMHLKASDWLQHRHQDDPAYDNVILHVVLENDQVIFRSNGKPIPCLELKSRIPAQLAANYQRLLQMEGWIPCERQLQDVPSMTRKLWLDRLLVERLEQKTVVIEQALERNQYHWEESFFQQLAKGFGLRINAEPFEMLARSLPLLTLLKHKHSLLQLEALLFGQAGMLEVDFADAYPQQLKKEFQFLKAKYALRPIPFSSWKFARLRPAAFPTIRIAQLAALIYQTDHLFSKILAAKHIKELENTFVLKLSNYWRTHYRFDKLSARRQKRLGTSTIHLLIINVISPFIFLYGKHKGEERYQEQALHLLEQLPPEQNKVIKNWSAVGIVPESAYQSQALLQLKKHYCTTRRCLSCSIGNSILKRNVS